MSARPSSDVAIHGSGLVLRTVQTEVGASIALRPINTSLFIESGAEYETRFAEFVTLLSDLSASHGQIDAAHRDHVLDTKLVGRVLYTTLQAIGCGMDCLCPPQQARKNFGMRFEELVRDLFGALGFDQVPVNFALPYTNAAGQIATFRNQVDLVISPTFPVQSNSAHLDPTELVVSIKTSSKDRFSKIFLDKELLRWVTNQEIPVLALFHNDVQRSGDANVSTTFVAGNFSAYVECFGPLTGVYYVDPPPHINQAPWDAYLRTFDTLVLVDLWNIAFGGPFAAVDEELT